MHPTPNILPTPQRLVWLALCLLVMPGTAASGQTYASSCEVTCPCERLVVGSSDACDTEHEAPDSQPCPEDCPDCRCCPGHIIAALPTPIPLGFASFQHHEHIDPPGRAELGALKGVFRPPR